MKFFHIPRRLFKLELLSNCVGLLSGGDFGVDFLAQIFEDRTDRQFTTNTEMDFIHVVTAGPIGVQVGWLTENGPENVLITDVSIGASLGAALIGWTRCYVEGTTSLI